MMFYGEIRDGFSLRITFRTTGVNSVGAPFKASPDLGGR